MPNLSRIQEAVRTTFGAQLGKIERWSTFRNGETTQEWVEFIGATAVVLSHQEHMVPVAKSFVQNEPSIALEDHELFLIGHAVHDVGEAFVGDKAAPAKTARFERTEHKRAVAALQSLDQELGEDGITERAYREVVMGENAVLHHLFLAIERTEYFMTAITGFRYLLEHSDESINKWLMVTRVLGNDLPRVIDFAIAYPHSIGQYLRSQVETIDRMFVETAQRASGENSERLVSSHHRWQEFIDQSV